ncbi:hypothetical protein KFK09_019916 [Dendrobium nobile]|uniref:Uncharacterized protein n=1 Tax=Dendrobium nobile TaxID=94219 RepID=A0A8T3AQV4_DENNO|nr:hypothetical protein KFK09_019916 [Dendrobium nobile]
MISIARSNRSVSLQGGILSVWSSLSSVLSILFNLVGLLRICSKFLSNFV